MKTKLWILFWLLLAGIFSGALYAQPVKAGIIVVPDDYPAIQQAIDSAASGDTVYVRAGTYFENVTINKAISLIGEDKNTTIINGRGAPHVTRVCADNVSVSGFTFTNSSGIFGQASGLGGLTVMAEVGGIQISDIVARDNGGWGVHITPYSHGINITRAIIINNGGGLLLHRTWNVNAYNNTIMYCDQAIAIIRGDHNNIFWNRAVYNRVGLSLQQYSNTEYVADNVFVNNSVGIDVSYSSNMTLRGNEMTGNWAGLSLQGEQLDSFLHDIDTSNTINGKPAYYWVNKTNQKIPDDAGYVGVVNSSNITVQDLTMTANGQGVLLAYTKDSVVRNVTAKCNIMGIGLFSSYNNTLANNTASMNFMCGIGLFASGNNTLRDNVIANATIYGFGVGSPSMKPPTLDELINDVDVSNTVEGKPIYYWVGESNKEIPADAGCAIVVDSENITIRNLTLEKNYDGVVAAYSSNVQVENLTLRGNFFGAYLIELEQSSMVSNKLELNYLGIVAERLCLNNSIIHNEIVGTKNAMPSNPPVRMIPIALWTENSADLQIRNNSVTNSVHGVYWLGTNSTVFAENIVSGNDYGITLAGSNDNNVEFNNVVNNHYWGVALGGNSTSNLLTSNTIGNNSDGIYLSSGMNNSIVGNTLITNVNGIELYYNATGNTIYHNNIIESANPVHSESTNVWDNGCEGNFWTSYAGIDTDSDGVGDTYLPCEGVDSYPLMNVYWDPTDINHDLKVDIRDLAKAARAFGTDPDDPLWNPHADITGPKPLTPDNKVDIRDISMIAKNFGKTYP